MEVWGWRFWDTPWDVALGSNEAGPAFVCLSFFPLSLASFVAR